MRTMFFWFGLATALLGSMVEPAWGYAAIFALAVVQILFVGRAGQSTFLLLHYVTVLVYFSVAPAAQIANDVAFWDAGVIGRDAHRVACMLLLLYMAGIELAAALQSGAAPVAAPAPGQRPLPRALTDPAFGLGCALVLLAMCALALGVLLTRPDLNFVARGVVSEEIIRPFESIVFSTLPKTLVLVGFVVLAINASLRPGVLAVGIALLALVMAAVSANPVNTARQILIVGLLPGLIYLFGARHRLLLAVGLFVAIAGIGPVLNFFSRDQLYGVELASFPNSQDFDAMYVIAGLLERTQMPEPGLGRYLLSALSFMLPRELKLFPEFDPLAWPEVANHFSQTNLSFPPFMTAYLDFGLFGPLLLGFCVARGFRWIERRAAGLPWLSVEALVGMVLLAAYVPFIRGPILGWGPFVASGLLSALLVGWTMRAARVARPAPAAAALQMGHGS